MHFKERLLNAPIVLASFVLSSGWKLVEFLTSVEGIQGSPTLGPLAKAVAARLPDLPTWVVIFAWAYLFVWLFYGQTRKDRRDVAPRLVLVTVENDNLVERSLELMVENVGERDAFTVLASVLRIGKFELRPRQIPRLAAGDRAMLLCDVVEAGDVDKKQPLGAEIVRAYADFNPWQNPASIPANNEFLTVLRITYRDQEGLSFEDYFKVKVWWPLGRIREPEKYWPTPWEAFRTWTGAKHRILEA